MKVTAVCKDLTLEPYTNYQAVNSWLCAALYDARQHKSLVILHLWTFFDHVDLELRVTWSTKACKHFCINNIR